MDSLYNIRIARNTASDACGRAAQQLRLAAATASEDQSFKAGAACGLAISALEAIRQDREPDVRISPSLRIAKALEALGEREDIDHETLASLFEATAYACMTNRLV